MAKDHYDGPEPHVTLLSEELIGKYLFSYVFIPSTTELGDTDHKQTYQLGSTYPYFQGADDNTRITSLDGEIWWYWTRSPASCSSFVRDVSSSGAFHEDSVYNVGYGVRYQ